MTEAEELAWMIDRPELEVYRAPLAQALEQMRTDTRSVAWAFGEIVGTCCTLVAGGRARQQEIPVETLRPIQLAHAARVEQLGLPLAGLLTMVLLRRWYRFSGLCGTCGDWHSPLLCPTLRMNIIAQRLHTVN